MCNKSLQVEATGTVAEIDRRLWGRSYIMLSKISRLSQDGKFIRIKMVDEDNLFFIMYTEEKYAAKAYDEFSKFLEG